MEVGRWGEKEKIRKKEGRGNRKSGEAEETKGGGERVVFY